MRLTSTRAIWLGAIPVGVFQVIGSFGAANNQPERRGVDALALALIVLGPIALLWWRRHPIAALALAAVASDVYVGRGYAYGPIFLSVAVSLFFAVQLGRRTEAATVAALAFVGFMIAGYVDPRSSGPGALHYAVVAGWLGAVMAVSEVVRIRRAQLADDERRRAGELRLQVAQELHDVLAHNISLINVQASVGLHLVDENPTQAQDALRNIKTASSEALHELRTALDLLRGGEAADRAPAPRLADLDALVDGTRATGLQVELLREGDAVALPADVELAAYRIVQEALTNVTRHARANRVTVRVGYQDGVTVEVVDNGVGGAANAGNGIAGMRERAAALGGSVEIGPQPGSGFRVMAHLPLRPS
ncbi:MAG: hypothetical protein QOF21_999 [Actinomycetota bacterium]|jgi:signal transduction histidine kinase